MMPDALALLAFDEAPVGLVLTEYRIIRTANRTFAQMLGYRKDELEGHSFRMLYGSDEEFEHIRDVGIGSLSRRGVYTDERLMRRRDGSRFWCRFRAHTLTPNEPLQRTILSYAQLSGAAARISLTARERQVVMHLSRGLTSKETARELGLSPRTIEDVRARLRRKFKARNTAELLAQLTGLEG